MYVCNVMKKQKLIYDAVIITYWRNNYYLVKMTYVPPVRTISADDANKIFKENYYML